jgi:putative YphP/YqiW family bacilliredoxin
MYPIELTMPMAKELTEFGFESLTSAAEVEAALKNQEGTTLLVVNSVCGCAAANARPAVKFAVKNGKTPDKLYTVFAGVDTEAVAMARDFLLPYPPSSPAMALFKDGKIVHMIERRNIEGYSAQMIADSLLDAFEKHC